MAQSAGPLGLRYRPGAPGPLLQGEVSLTKSASWGLGIVNGKMGMMKPTSNGDHRESCLISLLL